MAKDVANHIKNCLQCIVSADTRPRKQAELTVMHPKRRFEQVAIDDQTLTPRTARGNIKVFAMIDVLTRFVRAVAIKNEKSGSAG